MREVIHAFNETGFAALDPKWSGGRPRKFGPAARELICRIARSHPAAAGPAVHHLEPDQAGRLPGRAPPAPRSAPRPSGGSCARPGSAGRPPRPGRPATTRTSPRRWPGSSTSTTTPPADGRVICVDEFGPLNLQPRPGRGWFPRGRPARLRATYTRTAGVRHMFAALDLATGQLFYRFRDRKRWQEFLDFLRQLRRRFPAGRLYVVCDNFSPHHKAEVRDLVRRPRRRVGVHPDQRLLAELDRVPSSPRCATSPSTAATTPPTPRKRPRSPATSAGPTSTPTRSGASPSTPRSADPITYPTLPDAALAGSPPGGPRDDRRLLGALRRTLHQHRPQSGVLGAARPHRAVDPGGDQPVRRQEHGPPGRGSEAPSRTVMTEG